MLTYPTRTIDQDSYRLIPSRFPPIDVYERLGDASIRSAAQELEARTNPRLAAMNQLENTPKPGEKSANQFQNWNHAPFVYKNPEGSYFLGPTYGVLEVASDVKAALALALQRREEFLSRTDEAPINLDMRLLCTRVAGKLRDLTGLGAALAQPERWKIGQRLCDDGAAGILFCRPGFGDHRFLSVFDGSLLGRSLQGAHYRFVWDGGVIRSIYDFASGSEILRGELLEQALGRDAAE